MQAAAISGWPLLFAECACGRCAFHPLFTDDAAVFAILERAAIYPQHKGFGGSFLRPFVLALSSVLLLPLAAHADTFNIAVTINGNTTTGTISGDKSGDGFLITSVSSAALFGLPASDAFTVTDPANSIFGADNMFYPTESRLFDIFGLEINGAFGSANLFSANAGPNYAIQYSSDFSVVDASVSLVNSASTPEPSSVVLSFTGLLAAAALVLRKRSGAAAFSNLA